MIRVHPEHRRSFALIAVLVIVGASLLVATSLLFVSQTEIAVSAAAGEITQSRALACSGLQAVMAQLNDQRATILRGETPQIDGEIVVYEAGSRLGIARLMPVSGASGGPNLIAEAGKADVNQIDAEALAATDLVDPEVAHAIVSHVQSHGRRLQSVNELMRVPGGLVTADLLIGSVEGRASKSGGEIDRSASGDDRANVVRGLADVLSAYTAEPLVQADGTQRINLNQSWSNELAASIAARFDQQVADQVKQLLDQGAKFKNDADIVRALRGLQVPLEQWPTVLDSFTTSNGTFQQGRLDINTASYESLLTLPGLLPEQAAQIVRARESLADSDRASVVWLMTQQIVTADQFEQLVDRITTRCWSWRVRVAGGEVFADEPDRWLGHPIIFEAVIDLSDVRPRIAYLRDVTVLQETLAIVREASRRAGSGLDEQPAVADSSGKVEGELIGEAVDKPLGRELDAKAQIESGSDKQAPAESRIGRWRGR